MPDPNDVIQERLKPIVWRGHQLDLLDQRQLPLSKQFIQCTTPLEVAQAIQDMVVRGAPAIGIAAAYGFVLALSKVDVHKELTSSAAQAQLNALVQEGHDQLLQSRPTAVNLHHAMARMQVKWRELFDLIVQAKLCLADAQTQLEELAQIIHHEDIGFNQAIAEHGLAVLEQGSHKPLGVLTHCNTGSLATGGLGTALGIIKVGAKRLVSSSHSEASRPIIDHIFITETRPWLQGSRLTAFELMQESLDFTMIVEGAAGALMQTGQVQWLIVGADRITANGDVANKVGTYTLALIAKAHNVKVMVAAPSTTCDFSLASGADIPIETRGAQEVLAAGGHDPNADISVFNPVFDITPAAYIDYIVTEQGAVAPAELAGLLA